MIELMNYVEGTIHGQRFARIFMPQAFDPQDFVHQMTGLGTSSIKHRVRKSSNRDSLLLDPLLARHDLAMGDGLTIADMALFYVEQWASPSITDRFC